MDSSFVSHPSEDSDIEKFNTPVDSIEQAEVMLLFVGIDTSSSMEDYESSMHKALQDFKESMQDSKEEDQILIARANFNGEVDIAGYKSIHQFDTSYNPDGMTSLYDCICIGSEKMLEYMTMLKKNGMHVRGVFSIFSDGVDNNSSNSISKAQIALNNLKKKEIATAIICFGSEAEGIGQSLDFKNILEVSSSPSELRKAFNVLSKSAIATSKAAGAADDVFKF